MHILCIGLSHQTAPVQLRERLAFSDEAALAALARVRNLAGSTNKTKETAVSDLTEIVILSTCNRVELYAVSADPSYQALESLLAESRGVPAAEFQDCLYRLSDEQAADHLLRVAAGLNSLVIGESQVLGQVTHALELARSQNAAGPVLARLCQTAIYTGKRVRTETRIAHNPASISSVAVRLAADVLPQLEAARITVLGAGKMAELVVEALRKRGAGEILVVNRTLERARELAQRWEAQTTTYQNLDSALEFADIVITSTGAPHTLIAAEQVEAVMQRRPGRPLVMIDIAVPRDVDPDACKLPGVRLYDMDALQDTLDQSLAARKSEIPLAETIIAQELGRVMEFIHGLEALNVIRLLHQQADAIRQAELEKALRHLPGLSPAERERIEILTEALVKKLLHAPTARLRAEAQSAHLADYAFLTRNLFSLPDDSSAFEGMAPGARPDSDPTFSPDSAAPTG